MGVRTKRSRRLFLRKRQNRERCHSRIPFPVSLTWGSPCWVCLALWGVWGPANPSCSHNSSSYPWVTLHSLGLPPAPGLAVKPNHSRAGNSRISSLDVQPLCLLWSLFCSFQMFRDIPILQQEMFALLFCHQFPALLLSPFPFSAFPFSAAPTLMLEIKHMNIPEESFL